MVVTMVLKKADVSVLRMVGGRAVRLEGSTVCLLVVWMGAMTAGVLGDPMVGDLVDVRVSQMAADLVDELVAWLVAY
jgi:hypothetical protein